MSERLTRCEKDTIHLCAAVEPRFLDVCDLYARVKGEQLTIPDDIKQALVHWRTMIARFKRGDMRATPSEEKSLKELAQWTLDWNNKLRNQPSKTMQWAL